MTTLNISLPDSMRAFIDAQIATGGYSTASEYVRELVRADQKRAAKERLDQLLIEGIESGPSLEISDAWWEEKKARLIRRAEEKKA